LSETITACLITRDEEDRLPAALASVAFCDQIVVVDSGSTDRTREIAREAGALVLENPWPGYSAQRNVALDQAGSDWVIEVDADETLSRGLQEEIQSFLAAPPAGYDICALPQFHRFLGAELRRSMKYPGYRTRMFRRGAYRHDESLSVHEGIWPKGPVWPFEHDMSHELAGSWGEALRDTRNYTRLSASFLTPPESARALVVGAGLRPLAKFWYRVVVDGGWRDGFRGLARIALDCTTDALVWVRRTRAGRHAGDAQHAASVPGHFAAERPAGWGSPLVFGVASGAKAAETAQRRLAAAKAEGIDVSLVTDAPPADTAVRVRRMSHFGPLQLARALDAERQLRGRADALLVEGRLAESLIRRMPASLQAYGDQVASGETAPALKRRLAAAGEQSAV
jgi:hypothetical protein